MLIRPTLLLERDSSARGLADGRPRSGAGLLRPQEISREEFVQLASELGVAMTPEETNDALRSMDKDGDGEISKREFAKWWKVIDGSRTSVPPC
eukprot:COSAG01_NODE_8463_length_2777_cov_3.846527_3_plen_94_part_00